MAQDVCPLCTLRLSQPPRQDGDATFFPCRICGTFGISSAILAEIPGGEASLREAAIHSRRIADAGGLPPVFFHGHWPEPRAGRPNVASLSHNVLLQLAESSTGPGSHVRLNDPADQMRVALRADLPYNVDLHYLLRALHSEQLIEWSTGNSALVLAKGWRALDEAPALAEPGRCFVAMSFAPELSEVFQDGIRPAVEKDCKGGHAVRLDFVEHAGPVDERMVGEIRRAQFVVADFTGHRNGVYFESGFALGIGRPVIWCCRKDAMVEAHFDTRQFNYIDWTDPANLRVRLARRIVALGLLPPAPDYVS